MNLAGWECMLKAGNMEDSMTLLYNVYDDFMASLWELLSTHVTVVLSMTDCEQSS